MKKEKLGQGFRSDRINDKFSELYSKQNHTDNKPYIPRKYDEMMFERIETSDSFGHVISGARLLKKQGIIDEQVTTLQPVTIHQHIQSIKNLRDACQEKLDRLGVKG